MKSAIADYYREINRDFLDKAWPHLDAAGHARAQGPAVGAQGEGQAPGDAPV